MSTILIFSPPLPPSEGTSATQKVNLKKAEFGDGYIQTTRVGLRHVKRSLKLSWDLLHPNDAETITRFFRQHGGEYPFYYTPSDELYPIMWTCSDWTDTRIQNGYRQISATLEESFDTRTITDMPTFYQTGSATGRASARGLGNGNSAIIRSSYGFSSGTSDAVTTRVDTGTLIYLDFIGLRYSVNAVETALSTVLDRTDNVTGSGMKFDWNINDDSAAIFQPAAIAALPPSGGMTIICEWVMLENYRMFPFEFWSTTGSYFNSVYVRSDVNYVSVTTRDALSVYETPQSGTTYSAGAVRRIAVNRQKNRTAFSYNGGTVVGQDFVGVYEPLFANGYLGGYSPNSFSWMNGYIRRFIVYPLQNEADLPALSTIA